MNWRYITIWVKLETEIPGDVIHLLGYYPPNPTTTTTGRPRPYKPFYTYPKPAKPSTTSTTNTNTFSHHDQQNQRPSTSQHSWDHETNHISFYPLVHPDEHFGVVEENDFGTEAEAAVFSHSNNYGDFSNKPTSYADNDYRPFQGISLNLVLNALRLVLLSFSFLLFDFSLVTVSLTFSWKHTR